LFAAARRWVGAAEVALELPSGARAGDVLAHPALAPHRASLRLAVNEEFAAEDRVLAEGDAVAVLPPVSGG
jgi:molybdopterin converting factor small subunit